MSTPASAWSSTKTWDSAHLVSLSAEAGWRMHQGERLSCNQRSAHRLEVLISRRVDHTGTALEIESNPGNRNTQRTGPETLTMGTAASDQLAMTNGARG